MSTPRKLTSRIVLLAVIGLGLAATGCSNPYLRDRGHDALDIFDVGILVSDHLTPDFAAFISFWNLFTLGYAHVDGKLIGIGDSRFGVLDFRHLNTWGVFLYGNERHGIGRTYTPVAANQPVYSQGIIRVLGTPPHPPLYHSYFACDRTFVLGWIGLHLRIRLDQMLDFVTGWFGGDLMEDDEYGPISRAAEAQTAIRRND